MMGVMTNSEREARYAELIGRLYLTTSGGGVHSIEDIARAVMAMADSEQAELRAEIEGSLLGGSYDLAAVEWERDQLRAQLQLMCDHQSLSGVGDEVEDRWQCDECKLTGTHDEIEVARGE